jgi:hypothetical protein
VEVMKEEAKWSKLTEDVYLPCTSDLTLEVMKAEAELR